MKIKNLKIDRNVISRQLLNTEKQSFSEKTGEKLIIDIY